jgi:hypothetical protein
VNALDQNNCCTLLKSAALTSSLSWCASIKCIASVHCSTFLLFDYQFMSLPKIANSVTDSPVTHPQLETRLVLRLLCPPWWVGWWDVETATITFRERDLPTPRFCPHGWWISIEHNNSIDAAWRTFLRCLKVIKESRVVDFPDTNWSSHKARISNDSRKDRRIALLSLHLASRRNDIIPLSNSGKHDSGCF